MVRTCVPFYPPYDAYHVSARRAGLRVLGDVESPCRVLVNACGGPLAHERRWYARRTPRGDALVDENESTLSLECVTSDTLREDVFALPVLAV